MNSAASSVDANRLMAAGLDALRRHEQEINRLNVFPVPDGDTGTNLVMTVQTVCEQLSQAGDDLQGQLKAITTGSLMGARGNSGVILSQIVRGVCEVFGSSDGIDAAVVAEALANGVKVAYQAIRKPVEGTMLTVIRDAADVALAIAGEGERDMLHLINDVVLEAGRSVDRTPELLPVLKEAGVVDAGGYGLTVLGRGIAAALGGAEPVGGEPLTATGSPRAAEEIDLDYRYCTEFVIVGGTLDVKSAEEFLESVGGSVMIAASPGLSRIHVHTNDPGKILEYACGIGSLDQIQINNMERQVVERNEALRARVSTVKTGMVAVASGDGVTRILRSLGVDRVVSGGQTMNPSAEELAGAVEALPQDEVIVLPNNKNIVLAAEQAARLVSKQTVVVPTTSMPEGFAALLAFDEEAEMDANIAEMTKAAAGVRTGEITHAVRSGSAGVLRFRKGDMIGLADGRICVVGRKLVPTARRLVETMLDGEAEVVTLLFGVGADAQEIEDIARHIRRRHPGIDVDVQRGGQPLYPLIVGVE